MNVLEHERIVAKRFDELVARFKARAAADDHRLEAITKAIGSVEGLRILDFGSGKGRFATRLEAAGAEVVGLDRSSAMLRLSPLERRVLAGGHGLPFAAESFDAAIVVEVIEHMTMKSIDGLASELRRVLRPGGLCLILDKNLLSLNAKRPWLPNAVVKRIDEVRGRWMYPAGYPVRERWFVAGAMRRRLATWFQRVEVAYVRSPDEWEWSVFGWLPCVRRAVLWTAVRDGGRDE